MKNTYLLSLVMWVVFVVVAILNGIFRESVITPKTNAYTGHVLSSIIFIILIFVLTTLFIRFFLTDYTSGELLWVGTMWLGLTICFEFLFGHYVAGHSWSHLLADYNLLKGRIWSLVLLSTFIAPYVCGRLLEK